MLKTILRNSWPRARRNPALLVLLSISAFAQIPAGNVCNGGYFSGNQRCVSPEGRIYRVIVPANLPANAPIVIALHPSAPAIQYAANGMVSTSGWDMAKASANGFIAIFPEATIDPNGKKNWCIDFSLAPCRVDDSAYIRSLIVKYQTIYSTNPKRNYVAGFSMGAEMAFKLARDASDVIAAVAIIEGHEWVLSANMMPPHFAPISPVSVLIFSGFSDSILPTCGGLAASGNIVPSSDDDFSFWVHVDGLIDDTPLAAKALCPKKLTHKIATNGVYAVEFYAFPKGGHNWYRPTSGQWPIGSMDQLTVLRSDGVFVPNPGYQPDIAKSFPAGTITSDVVLKFFYAHPKP